MARRALAFQGMATLVLCATPVPGTSAQSVVMHAEPIAVSARLTAAAGPRVRIGAEVVVGPQVSATVAGEGNDVDVVAAAYAVVELGIGSRVTAQVSPVGVAVVIGNDFGQAYPGGAISLAAGFGRLRIATALRVVRIAGGNGTGEYEVTWVPVRLGMVL